MVFGSPQKKLVHHISLIFGLFILVPGLIHGSSAPAQDNLPLPTPIADIAGHLPDPASVAPTIDPKTSSVTKKPSTGGAPPASSFGIAAGSSLPTFSVPELNRRLDGMKSLGVGWVRYDIEWSNIGAAGPGQYNWSAYDRVAQAVAAHGLKLLLIIDYTPAWARPSDCNDSQMCAPADPGAYGTFAGAVAGHYKPLGIHYFEIWNEPNNVNFFRPAANAAKYTAMLRSAYTAIKSADSGSNVLTGGTSPADSSDGYLSPPDFVNGIYAAGAKGYFDALAHHPYTWPYSPAWPNPGGAWGQLTTLHNIMASNGDGAKRIWSTEFGAPTGGPGSIASNGFSTAEGRADHVTEGLQAKIAGDGIAIANRTPWMGPLFWYSYEDAGTTSDTVENFFGLVHADGSAKPGLQAFKSAIGG